MIAEKQEQVKSILLGALGFSQGKRADFIGD
jgi:hypothetical protein